MRLKLLRSRIRRSQNTTDSAEYFKASAEGGQWVTSYEEATKYTTDSTGIVDVKVTNMKQKQGLRFTDWYGSLHSI